MDAKLRLEELKKLLEYHIDRYYNQDSPEITDYEYDMMMQELKAIEKEHPEWITPDSPTQKVGGTAKRTVGVLVPHNVPMLSLQDVFSKEEVYDFVEEMKQKLHNPEFVVEYKIDGLSMGLRYEDGNLMLAVTRGDGVTAGEDVTQNAKVIKDVKQKLKTPVPYIEVRGEVYMKTEDFDRVNQQQELLGKKKFANPRNCAAGTLRQLDPKNVDFPCLYLIFRRCVEPSLTATQKAMRSCGRTRFRSLKIMRYVPQQMKCGKLSAASVIIVAILGMTLMVR